MPSFIFLGLVIIQITKYYQGLVSLIAKKRIFPMKKLTEEDIEIDKIDLKA